MARQSLLKTTSCASAPWLARPELQHVLQLLTAENGMARCVGGCVRDHLLGSDHPDTDVDIATTLTPQQTIKRLESGGVRHAPRGIEHGTVLAIARMEAADPPCLYEITSLRKDVETDGRHAKIALTDDWRADAGRRDLTVNALYCDGDGALHDPLGGGLADLAARRARFIGDADARIGEDYLRILRFFRFHARLAPHTPPDAAAISACAQNLDGLAQLSGERIQDEMRKILALPQADMALAAMGAHGVLPALLGFAPDAAAVRLLGGLIACADQNPYARDPLVRLAALMRGRACAGLAKHWRLSRADAARLAAYAMADNMPPLSEKSLRALIYWQGQEIIGARLALAQAQEPTQDWGQDWAAWLAYLQNWTPPDFPLNGKALQAAGVAAGEEMGVLLRALEAWWVDADFPPPDAVQAELRKRIG